MNYLIIKRKSFVNGIIFDRSKSNMKKIYANKENYERCWHVVDEGIESLEEAESKREKIRNKGLPYEEFIIIPYYA